ncbi:hypothetical protein [Thiomonas sp.]
MADPDLDAIKAKLAHSCDCPVHWRAARLVAEVKRLREALRTEREANERSRKVLERALIECDSLERGEAWWIAARNELGARITVRTPALHPQEPSDV